MNWFWNDNRVKQLESVIELHRHNAVVLRKLDKDSLERIEDFIDEYDLVVKKIDTEHGKRIQVEPRPRIEFNLEIPPTLICQDCDSELALTVMNSNSPDPVRIGKVKIPAGFWLTGITGAKK